MKGFRSLLRLKIFALAVGLQGFQLERFRAYEAILVEKANLFIYTSTYTYLMT